MKNQIQTPDHILVSSYIKGNESALSELIKRHRQLIFSNILKLVKDRELANDLFQDLFVKIINTLKSGVYNEEGKFLPWVLRISHNLCIDYFRKSKRIPTVGNGSGNEDFDIFRTIKTEDDNVEQKIIRNQILKDAKRLIEELPVEQREVLILRYYSDMSFQEIAEHTNVSINTALGRMRYALINLRKLVRDKQIILSI